MTSTRLMFLPGVAILALLTAMAWAADEPTGTAIAQVPPAEAIEKAADSLATDAPAKPAVEAPPSPADSGSVDAGNDSRMDVLIASLTIFVLAVFVGFEVITKVPPTLHTPLMSGSNAISGITIVGALLSAGYGAGLTLVSFVGLLAVVLATINAVGGFAVTHRMLAMFQKKK